MISPLCPIENSDLSQMKESLHSRHQIMITVPNVTTYDPKW